MSFFAFILIVFSAGLHASWNLLAKRATMSVAFYTAICITAMSCWLHVQFWTPLAMWSLPGIFYLYLFCSVASDVLYCTGLVRAYRTMEMSTAYPMMRALPLLLTAALTMVLGWGKALNIYAMIGMAVVFAGCLTMPMQNFRDFKLKNYLSSRMLFILVVACGTTGYTIFDSQAMSVLRGVYAEASKAVISISYYSTRGVCLSSTLFMLTMLMPEERKRLGGFFREHSWMPLAAGVFASLTYASVLLAMNYVDNVSYVQVFRQLGLIFGLLGGVLVLKEKCSAPKITGTLLIITGLILTVL